MTIRGNICAIALTFCFAALVGCASGSKTNNPPTVSSTGSSSTAPLSPQLLGASSWSNAGGADQAITAPLSELLNQNCLTCLGLQQPLACTLHAGNTPMS